MYKPQSKFLIMRGEILLRIIKKEIIVKRRLTKDHLGSGFMSKLSEVIGRDRFQLMDRREFFIKILLKIIGRVKNRRKIIMRDIQISEHDAERLRRLPKQLH